ncbi:MAG: SurA N-terminal domain-containing protein [Nitrospirota bacterium]
MIELIHRHPVLIKILLTVVTVTFIGGGGWLLGKEDVANYAAKVGKDKVTMDEYQDAVYRMEDFYRKIYKGNMPPDVMKSLDVSKRALDALIEKRLVLREAEKEGLEATESEVKDAIKDNGNFQGEGGGFDKERYLETLKANNMTPAQYEGAKKEELTVARFTNLVKDSVYVGDDEVKNYYKEQLAPQKKEYKEDEYQAQKENLRRMLTATAQESAWRSFIDTLRKNSKIEINPHLASEAKASS